MTGNDPARNTVAGQIDRAMVKLAQVEPILVELASSDLESLKDSGLARQLGKSLVSLGGDITSLGVSLALPSDDADEDNKR